MKHLDVTVYDMHVIQDILSAHLLPSTYVFLFGSRATNTAKPYSDLDLAIDAGQPVSLGLMASLTDAFEESLLSYKVDLVDWHQLSDAFKQQIASHRQLIWPC